MNPCLKCKYQYKGSCWLDGEPTGLNLDGCSEFEERWTMMGFIQKHRERLFGLSVSAAVVALWHISAGLVVKALFEWLPIAILAAAFGLGALAYGFVALRVGLSMALFGPEKTGRDSIPEPE